MEEERMKKEGEEFSGNFNPNIQKS